MRRMLSKPKAAKRRRNLLGGEGADTITGAKGNDLILGGGGDDTFKYSAGIDLIFGGAGNDTYQAGDGTVPEGANGRGSVTFFGGAGSHDKADYSQLDKALEVDFSVDIGSVHLTSDKETPWAVTLKHEGGEKDKFVEVEDFIGTRFGDTFKYKPSDGLFTTLLNGVANVLSFDFIGNANAAGAPGSADNGDKVDLSGVNQGVVIDLRNADHQFIAQNDGNAIKLTAPSTQWIEKLHFIPELIDTFGSGRQPDLTTYHQDSRLDLANAESAIGTSQDDVILGRGYAAGEAYANVTIDLGAGNDIAYMPRQVGTVLGGAGNDIIIGFNPDYLSAADSGTGQEQRLVLDGGADNDYVFSIGAYQGTDAQGNNILSGVGSVVIGGAGDDFLYNNSYKGLLYGDSVDGQGAGGKDVFWWSPGNFIMDAEQQDILQFYGLPLTGGYQSVTLALMGLPQVRDFVLPWITYAHTDGGQLLVINSVNGVPQDANEGVVLNHAMIVENYDFGSGGAFLGSRVAGDLGMSFYVAGDTKIGTIQSAFAPLVEFLAALSRFAKGIAWKPLNDPLVLDLDGDGIETRSVGAGPAFRCRQ